MSAADLAVSYPQLGVFLRQSARPWSPEFNIPTAVEIDGPVDADRLERAFRDVVAAQPSLRSMFTEAHGTLRARLGTASMFMLEQRDLTDLGPGGGGERRVSLRQALSGFTNRRFDLDAMLPIRAQLLRLGPDRSVLQWVVHHIAYDAWSRSNLADALSQAYRADASPDSTERPEDCRTRAVERFAGRLSNEADQRAGAVADYWRRRVAVDPVGVHRFGARAADTGPLAGRGPRAAVTIDRSVVGALGRRRSHGTATVFSDCLSAFAASVAALLGETTVACVVPYGARHDLALRDTVGLFTNHFPVLLRPVAGGTPVANAVNTSIAVRQTMDFRQFPLLALSSMLRREGLPGAALGLISFAFLNVPRWRLELDGTTVRAIDTVRDDTRFGIECHLSLDSQGGAAGHICCDDQLAGDISADVLSHRFTGALDELAALKPTVEREGTNG